jgi:hypothetical protein
MRRFLVKLSLLVGINVAIALCIITFVDARRSFQQWETDSILYATPKNEDFDFVCLGTSRARVFSEFKGNHDFVVRELGMKFLNLAIPFGGGILPEKMLLRYFFARGNRAKTVVFFLDPFMMFSDGSNKYHRFVFYEPFRVRFLFELIRNDIPIQQVITYVRSKFGYYWFVRGPVVKERDPRVAKQNETDAAMAEKRMESLYPDGLDERIFRRYCKDLAAILEMARKNDSRMIIIFPPTLLGPEPGAPWVREFLEQCKPRYDFEFYDYTTVLQDTGLFADHDHLNSKGFEYFVKEYIDPILRKQHA